LIRTQSWNAASGLLWRRVCCSASQTLGTETSEHKPFGVVITSRGFSCFHSIAGVDQKKKKRAPGVARRPTRPWAKRWPWAVNGRLGGASGLGDELEGRPGGLRPGRIGKPANKGHPDRRKFRRPEIPGKQNPDRCTSARAEPLTAASGMLRVPDAGRESPRRESATTGRRPSGPGCRPPRETASGHTLQECGPRQRPRSGRPGRRGVGKPGRPGTKKRPATPLPSQADRLRARAVDPRGWVRRVERGQSRGSAPGVALLPAVRYPRGRTSPDRGPRRGPCRGLRRGREVTGAKLTSAFKGDRVKYVNHWISEGLRLGEGSNPLIPLDSLGFPRASARAWTRIGLHSPRTTPAGAWPGRRGACGPKKRGKRTRADRTERIVCPELRREVGSAAGRGSGRDRGGRAIFRFNWPVGGPPPGWGRFGLPLTAASTASARLAAGRSPCRATKQHRGTPEAPDGRSYPSRTGLRIETSWSRGIIANQEGDALKHARPAPRTERRPIGGTRGRPHGVWPPLRPSVHMGRLDLPRLRHPRAEAVRASANAIGQTEAGPGRLGVRWCFYLTPNGVDYLSVHSRVVLFLVIGDDGWAAAGPRRWIRSMAPLLVIDGADHGYVDQEEGQKAVKGPRTGSAFLPVRSVCGNTTWAA